VCTSCEFFRIRPGSKRKGKKLRIAGVREERNWKRVSFAMPNYSNYATPARAIPIQLPKINGGRRGDRTPGLIVANDA
jgi:hypothetical protein